MNILIPHTWLLEHLETKATPEQIQKFVSLCGPSIERIYDREGEAVYDIEVTTNRVDSMSVRGIAREVAVILPQFGVEASLKPLPAENGLQELSSTPEKPLPLPKIANDPLYCKRITCQVLDAVKRTPTPDWMATRLRQIDQNVHDSVIDITNYVTHDLGHPCHAFDYDKVMTLGGSISVAVSEPGKKFVTLDGQSYTTVGGEVVYLNATGEIIDLPGIKGTLNTAIDDDTTRVLFWIESITPQKIRFASMTHNIRTVAAQLNEKNVDPALAEPTFIRGVTLYRELCTAVTASAIFDEYPSPTEAKDISVSGAKIANYLGLELPEQSITTILTTLECSVRVEDEEGHHVFIVTPPTFRPDLEIDVDVIEEIARIYGYHNLPSKLMATEIPLTSQPEFNFSFENELKHFLANTGWQEVYTYSMVSAQLAEESGYQPAQHLQLQNPLTDDRVYLRRSLLPSLREVITGNPLKKELSVFEIANCYTPQSRQLPIEEQVLGMLSKQPYRQVRGAAEALLEHFFVSDYVFAPPMESTKTTTNLKKWLDISAKTRTNELLRIGTIGIMSDDLVAAQFNLSSLLKVSNKYPLYQPIPKTSPVIEDMTFTVPSDTPIGELITTIKSVSPLIVQVDLKDTFKQNTTLTITYWDYLNALSNEHIEPLRKLVVQKLLDSHSATLVGVLE
ncbi:MAG: phenylalanine--tRNA ligase subunit beta [bacterium]|nr:phenylalanine--tRNA ligase subunit beta [bacterium]